MRIQRFFLGLILSLLASTLAAASGIDRVEPPHWWAGMKNGRLQLMLHGEGIGAAQASVQGQGVRVIASHGLSSPNYLFVDLELAPGATAQTLQIQLTREGREIASLPYQIKARRAGSADRTSFGRQDAIYLIVPDRFARAEPAEDRAGLMEGRDRANPGGRHGGNLRGITNHLDYIAGMGYTQIWPTPVVENDAKTYSYHGYAATDFYRIDPRFGSLQDYLDLSTQARVKGVGLIQDIVLNHIGVNHWWMRDLPAQDWLNRADPDHYVETHHARVSLDDPHAAPSDTLRFTDGWFGPHMPDLNQRVPELATYLTQMTLWWIEEADLSGLRVDTYSYSDREFIKRWNHRVREEYPQMNIVGEEWSPYPAIVARWQKSATHPDAAPSMMDFPLQGALLDGLSEGDTHEAGFMRLYEALGQDFVYPDAASLVAFVGNHDTPRVYSLLNEDLDLWKMAMAYLAIVQRTPQFFYGDELLFTSPRQRDDSAVRADFLGGFAGDVANGFTGAGLAPQAAEAQAWLRKLLNWRKGSAVVRDAALMHYAPLDGVYLLFRHGPAGKVMLVMNKNKHAVDLDTRRFKEMLNAKSRGVDVISGQPVDLGRSVKVPARGVMVVSVER